MLHSMLLLAAAIFTTDAAEPAAPPAAASPVTIDRTVAVVGPRTRICFKNPRAGSTLPTKICRTSAQWQRDGIDPVEALARR